MTSEDLLVIHTGRNGQLRTQARNPVQGETTPAQVDAIVESLRDVEQLVAVRHRWRSTRQTTLADQRSVIRPAAFGGPPVWTFSQHPKERIPVLYTIIAILLIIALVMFITGKRRV